MASILFYSSTLVYWASLRRVAFPLKCVPLFVLLKAHLGLLVVLVYQEAQMNKLGVHVVFILE